MSWKTTVTGVALALSVALGGTTALAQNDDLFAELEQEAQDVRELDLLQPLDVTVKSREELQQENLENMEDDFPADDTADWGAVLVFLGYIDEGDDIAQIYTGLMGDQILGYYDPATKQLVVVSTGTDEWNVTDKSTFVHETTHALQDQHFDLNAIMGAEEDSTDDLYFARTSLIEGDATLAETIYLIQNDLIDQITEEQADMDTTAVDNAPFFLTESLYFPYTTGAEFVIYLWQDGGWDEVNLAWENPPSTSEQIIHPEKYLDGEGAIPVAIADPLNSMSDWRLLEYNENGELGTRIFLQNSGASPNDAASAAEGWGGDATYIVTNDSETAMVWATTWDTDVDAAEFLTTLAEAESNRLGASFDVVDDSTMRLTGNGWYAEIHHDGADVDYYLAQSENGLSDILVSQEDAQVPSATPETDAESTPVAVMPFWLRETA